MIAKHVWQTLKQYLYKLQFFVIRKPVKKMYVQTLFADRVVH